MPKTIKHAPKMIFFNEKKIGKIRMIFDIEKLTLKVKFLHILTALHNFDSPNLVTSFDYS